MKLHHLALGARDVEAVASFYSRAFLLPEQRRFHLSDGLIRSIWLALEDGVLMIERVDGVRDRPTMEPGLFVIVFQVSDSEKQAAVERVVEAGGVLDGSTDFTIYLRDPEGSRVGVSSYPLDRTEI